MSEKLNADDTSNPNADQMSNETEVTNQEEQIVRLGRVSAFGPSLDGGFEVND